MQAKGAEISRRHGGSETAALPHFKPLEQLDSLTDTTLLRLYVGLVLHTQRYTLDSAIFAFREMSPDTFDEAGEKRETRQNEKTKKKKRELEKNERISREKR